MGEPAQERLVRKLDLERFIAQVEPNLSPNVGLEQYTISEHVASDILYLAAYANGDVVGKSVLDLGCGTGRLALGAAFLGARTVVGVDIDRAVVAIAVDYAHKTGLAHVTNWIAGEIDTITGKYDTVLQNPPFGVQTRHADRRFLLKALELGNKVYSLHNHPERDESLLRRLKGCRSSFLQVEPSRFVQRYIEEHGGVVEAVYALVMTIPHMFGFHTKVKHDLVVDLYVIRRNT